MAPEGSGRNLTNELAKERNREAADRTLMAWVRTSLALIGFGFAISQSYEYLEAEHLERTGMPFDALHAPLIFGTSLMVLGLLGTLGTALQYARILRRINSDDFEYSEPFPLAMAMAVVLLVIGLSGLIVTLI